MCIRRSLELVIFIVQHYMAIYVVQTDNVCLYCKKNFEQGRNPRSSWEIEVSHLCKGSQQVHQGWQQSSWPWWWFCQNPMSRDCQQNLLSEHFSEPAQSLSHYNCPKLTQRDLPSRSSCSDKIRVLGWNWLISICIPN